MLKYLVGFLKVLISILGILVASGTSLLIMDAASIRTDEPVYDQIITSQGVLLKINVTIMSHAYIFQINNGNLTLVLKTGDGSIVDKDFNTFNLPPGGKELLQFSLLIPNSTYNDFVNGNVQLFLSMYMNLWMSYQNFNLMGISLVTTTEIERGS